MKKVFFSKFYALLWVALLLAIDILSKEAALRWIPQLRGGGYPFGGIALFDFSGIGCCLNTVVNTGAAWGLFSDYSQALLIVRLFFVAALLIYLLRAPKRSLALWTLAAGALGNIIDMLRFGYVVDFLHVQFFGWSFPIFNFADSCITLSVIFLILWPNRHSLEGSKA